MGYRNIKNMNEKEAKHFYNSKEWKHKRREILDRDRHECIDCVNRLKEAAVHRRILMGDNAQIREGVEVHHLKELRDYPELALDNDNLITLCTQCHNLRHGRNPKRFVRKKKLISEERW